MRREWEPEELVAAWTLVEQDERELVAYKRGATRLGFALIVKFFEIEAPLPTSRERVSSSGGCLRCTAGRCRSD